MSVLQLLTSLQLVTALQLSDVTSTTDYCQLSNQHTLCINSGLGSACTGVTEQGFEPAEAAALINIHNELRSRIARGEESRGQPGPQPSAANMMELEWDSELALIAQSHADQCVFQHDCYPCRQSERFSVGQNLFISASSEDVARPDTRTPITSFYDEVDHFNKHDVSNFGSQSTRVGHFTQLVWAESRRVGCGYIKFKKDNFNKKLITCNYGPAGNMMGGKVYEVGSPCSQCPAGTACSSTYPGLCSPGGSGGILDPAITGGSSQLTSGGLVLSAVIAGGLTVAVTTRQH